MQRTLQSQAKGLLAKSCLFILLGLSSLIAHSFPAFVQSMPIEKQACTPEPPLLARLHPVASPHIAKPIPLMTVAMGAFLIDWRDQPVQNQTLIFKLDGAPIGTATTNPRGYAALLYNLPENLEASNQIVTVEFEETDLYHATSGTGNLDISTGSTVLQGPDSTGRQLTTVRLNTTLNQTNFPIPVTNRLSCSKLVGILPALPRQVMGGVPYLIILFKILWAWAAT